MLKQRLGAALLSLCLLAGAAVPAQAEEENRTPPRISVLVSEESEASGGTPETPETPEASDSPEGVPDSAGYYALEPPAPGKPLLAAARAGEIVDSGTCGDNLTWTLDSEGTLTVSGTGDIKSSAFYNKSNIKAVVCRPGVTGIENYSFQFCSNLQSVNLPNTLVSIGQDAFSSCRSLTSVTFGNGLVQIGTYAFRYCDSLGAVTLPASLRTMGNRAFYDSGVTGVTFEEGASFQGEEVFRECSRLTRAVLPSSLKSIPSNTFYACENLVDVPLPEGLAAIGGSAFYGCSHLPRVEIPAGVRSIGNKAFQNCTGVSSVSFPAEGLEFIGSEAFRGCTGLRSVTIPASAAQNFADDSTAGTIGEYAFADSGVSSVIFAEGSIVAASRLFQNCDRLTAVNFASTMTNIGFETFRDCDALVEVGLPDRMQGFGSGAFYSCDKLASLTLPEGFRYILHDAFNGCLSLETVRFPENTRLTEIGANAFQGCVTLRSVVIPESSSVSTIGDSAFQNCSLLKTVSLPFADTSTGVRSIGKNAFRSCKSLTDLVLRDGPTDIGASAFQDCSSLPSLTFSNKVTTVGQNAFSGCVSLAGAVYFGSSEDWSYTTDKVSSGNQYLLNAMANADYREIEVTRVELSKSILRLPPGRTATLTAAVIPYDATDRTVVWTSSAPGVASVSSAGAVQALAAGQTVITASAGGRSAACRVIVDRFPVESVTLDLDTLELLQGQSYSLQAAVGPDYAADQTVAWTSSAPGVASVSPDGTVIAVGAGKAVITAKAGEVTASCTVTVTVIPVERVTLGRSFLTLTAGSSQILTAAVFPENATDKAVAWTSSAPGVASVSPDGTVMAVGAGEAVITASAGGKSASCQVTVRPVPVSRVTLNKTSLSLITGRSEVLTAAVLPENATDKAVAWTSSNPKAASVSQDGTVRALSPGKATVTASAGGKSASCVITVQDPITASVQESSSNSAAVRITLAPGVSLPPRAAVFAAKLNGDTARFEAAASGTLDAAAGKITFQKALTSGDRLFFLDPDTFIPLAKPVTLQ